VARIADADPAEHLDPLGERVYELGLLLVVLVEEEVELVEGRPDRVPVGLLVERREDHRVRLDLAEDAAALGARIGGERDRELAEGPEALELAAGLAQARLG
jgi:hypothetical protein